MLCELNEAGKHAGLKINYSKTKTMCNSAVPDTNTIITIDNSSVEEVDKYIYI